MWIHLNQKTKTWCVTSFCDEHNHELTSPSSAWKHRSRKAFHRSQTVKNLMEKMYETGLRPSTIAKVVNAHGNGEDEMVTTQQCVDYLRVQRKNMVGRECISIVHHFLAKRVSDPSFFFAMDLKKDHNLKIVFWADGRSISSYLQFSDVVSFDVTYRTNKFSLPFAPFTGVNHHRQSILFGCALLANEKEKSFIWLFQEWKKCMCGKDPGVIITDQDHAICNAIKKVFPNARHRFCSWHIEKHITERLHLLRSKNQNFVISIKYGFIVKLY